MSENADDSWKILVRDVNLILMHHLNVIKGYSQLIKEYTDQHEAKALILFEELTLDEAATRILKSVDELVLLQRQLQEELRKSHNDGRGINDDSAR